MIAVIIVLALISGTALGIAAYCIRGLKEIRNIIDIYESHMIDTIEEFRKCNEDNNN